MCVKDHMTYKKEYNSVVCVKDHMTYKKEYIMVVFSKATYWCYFFTLWDRTSDIARKRLQYVELKLNEAGIKVCSLTASTLRVLRSIANWNPHDQPITTKSRTYIHEDWQFIAKKIKHLLAERIKKLNLSLASGSSDNEGWIWSP